MSTMYRVCTSVPRLSRRLVRHLTTSPRVSGFCRRYEGPRWLPVLSRRSMDFPTPFNMMRMMDEKFRDMQRIMDEFNPAGYEYAKPSRDMEVTHNKKEFEVRLDLGNEYSPEEVQVKVVDDVVEIHGKHSTKSDDTKSSFLTQFQRQFRVPEDVEPDSLECSWTEQGTLVIRGYVKGSENVKERVINIKTETPPPEGAKKD